MAVTAAFAVSTGDAVAAPAPVKLASRTLAVAPSGRLQLRVACRAAASRLCHGRLAVSWLVARKRHTLGRAQFTVTGRTAGVVTIFLTFTQRRTLRQAHKLPGSVTIVARSGSSRSVSTTTSVTFRARG